MSGLPVISIFGFLSGGTGLQVPAALPVGVLPVPAVLAGPTLAALETAHATALGGAVILAVLVTLWAARSLSITARFLWTVAGLALLVGSGIGLLSLLAPVEAVGGTRSLTTLEFSWPRGGMQWLLYGGGFVLALLLAATVAVRDLRSLGPVWRFWLTALRLAVIAELILISLNPQERTQKMSWRPSRVAILLDTSISMNYPVEAPPADASPAARQQPSRSRAAAVQEMLAESELLAQLRAGHEVSIYTFDRGLSEKQLVLPSRDRRSVVPGTAEDEQPDPLADFDWKALLQPEGDETRLGEALVELINQEAGATLSGVVVVSDGGLNAGVDAASANQLARGSRPPVRLITVGVGSTRKQANLRIAAVRAPTDVHLRDGFEIAVDVIGQELAGRTVEVELLLLPSDDPEGQPTLLETQEIRLLEDGVAAEAVFQRQPSVKGEEKYVIRARPAGNVVERDEADNETTRAVNIIDRKTRVLLVASGPLRDYRFLRNMLYRHSAISLDVWLQTVDPSSAGQVSQESENLLTGFPESEAEMFEYDVVVAFDPDWTRISENSRKLLVDWVDRHSGGLILVAGEVNTPRMAADEDYEAIRRLYPVELSAYLVGLDFDRRAAQPWPVEFTPEGRAAGFLQISDDPVEAREFWDIFPGFYRAYPTEGIRGGTTVLAWFTDERASTEYGQPVLLASQYYGSGRCLFVGTTEFWRMRRMSEEYYDRLWTRLIREVGQARLRRGSSRAILMPGRKRYHLGETVRVEARLFDPQFQPLALEQVPLEVIDPNGRPLIPSRTLLADPRRPGQYTGDFRVTTAGTWKMELQVPDSREVQTESIEVQVPQLESDHPELNAGLLTEIVRDTGGRYLSLEESPGELPGMLPSRGREFPVEERLQTLWDRDWLLYLLVALLSVEWLTRKLHRLA